MDWRDILDEWESEDKAIRQKLAYCSICGTETYKTVGETNYCKLHWTKKLKKEELKRKKKTREMNKKKPPLPSLQQ